MSYNKFKSTEFKDVNSLGYAIKSIGDVICNGTSNINGNMNVTGLTTFIGNSNVLPSTNTGGNSGLSIYLNLNTGSGETCLLNMGQGGPGAFSWYSSNYLYAPKTLMYLDYNCNLSNLNNVSCVSVTSTGGITNSNTAITDNSTLAQVGTSTFSGLITSNGGITNNGALSVSGTSSLGTLNVSGTTNLTGVSYTSNGITNSNAAIINNSALTQVGTSVFADIVRVSPGKSLYISDNTFTNYLRMHHTGIGGNSIIDFTGNFSIRNGIPSTSITTPFTINGATNQGTFSSNLNTSGIINSTNAITNNSTLSQVGTSTFTGLINSNGGITNSNAAITNNSTLSQVGAASFNSLSSTSITNTGLLSTGNIEISSISPAYIDLKTTAGNGDYDCRISCTTGLVGTAGKGNLSFNCLTTTINSPLIVSGITNSAVLTQNGVANINNNLNVTGVTNLTSLEFGPNGTNYSFIDIKTTGGNSDYDARIGVLGGSSTTPGQGALSFDCSSFSLNSNLTTTGNISCNTLTATTYNVGSTSYTGPIYMSNASPIYLKSSTDSNNYIKYDSVYDGPQLGFYTGLSLKCTNNNAIILNTSKTDMNINVNTKINGNLNVSGGMNNSLYYSVKGSTYNNSTATTAYYYIKYDGSSGSSASETFQMQSYAICAKITYSYYSDFPSNVYQGTSEYVVYGANFSAVSMAWSVGSIQYQPVITCSSSGLITVQFAKNTALSGHIYWSVGVLII